MFTTFETDIRARKKLPKSLYIGPIYSYFNKSIFINATFNDIRYFSTYSDIRPYSEVPSRLD